MNPIKFLCAAGLVAGILVSGVGCTTTGGADSGTGRLPHIEREADRILYEMGEHLKSTPQFSFRAEVSYDSMRSDGLSVRYGGVTNAVIRRPDRFRTYFVGDERETRSFYDGKTVTIHDGRVNMYAITEVPPNIDDAIDTLFDLYGFSVPIADVAYADPYAILIENVDSGIWAGKHSIAGVPCNHLAFTQETIDWQIWIEDSATPWPRQVLITYKEEPGSPQYLARFADWNPNPQTSDDTFKFKPPTGADEIEFLPIAEMEEDGE